MANQPQQQLEPFYRGTRRNRVAGPTAALPASGAAGTIPLAVPRSGLGAQLWIKLTLNASTGAGTPAWVNSFEQVRALIPGIRLSNTQNLIPVNLSLEDLRLALSTQARAYDITNAPGWAGALPAASSTFTWTLIFPVPISVNTTLNYPDGLILLGSSTVDWTLSLDVAALSSVVSGVTITPVSSSVRLYLEYYDIPSIDRFAQLPLDTLHVMSSQTIQASSLTTGQFQLEISPLQGKMVGLYGQFVGGATPATYAGLTYWTGINPAGGTPFIQDYQMILANVLYPDANDAFLGQAVNYQNYGLAGQPAGTVIWLDALRELGLPNAYSLAYAFQMLDPSVYSSVRLAATLNANGGTLAYAKIVRRYLQRVAYQ